MNSELRHVLRGLARTKLTAALAAGALAAGIAVTTAIFTVRGHSEVPAEAAVRAVLDRLDPGLPLSTLRSLSSVVDAIACFLPAWRSTRVSPLTVLREP